MWQVGHQVPYHFYAIFFGIYCKMGHTTLGCVDTSSAKLLLGYIFSCNGLYNLGTGKEHIAGSFGHDIEVGKGRGVNGPAGTWTEYCRNLGNDTGCQYVSLENFRVTCECIHTLLDTGSS
ncbi:hypothetical protein SDC9_61674 [bioreactor metagenome]|uniref:Uncharacterized protein n=1 Tax=bioreactor metagenome TaxID=1076179 RepID=A0A644XGD8_9ZZZZ